MRESCDIVMSKGGDAMPAHRRLTVRMRPLRVLQGLAGMLVPGEMLRLPVLLRYPMGVRGAIV
jgi:hypothetical protein